MVEDRTSWWRFVTVAGLLAVAPFLLGRGYELATPGPFDSGSYVHSAQKLLEGARIGTDEKPSALPGTLSVNILGVWLCGYRELGPKLLQTGLQLVALVLMLVAVGRLWGRVAAASAVVLASLYLSAPAIAKYGNVKEQYMVACLIIGVSCFVMHQLGAHRRWAMAAGAALAWAPLFKQTGVSGGVAVLVFLVAQPFLGHRSWRRTGSDALLLVAGAAAGLLPVLTWLVVHAAPWRYWPYSSFIKAFLPGRGAALGSYVATSRELIPLSEQAAIVVRYYLILGLPIVLAVYSFGLAVFRWVKRPAAAADEPGAANDRFVLLLAVWWLVDTALVWVSPRSYEQYYLPMVASGSMLAAFAVAQIWSRARPLPHAKRLVLLGVGALLVAFLAHPIVIGMKRSPHSGEIFAERRKGFAQTSAELLERRQGDRLPAWELAAAAAHRSTSPTDRIYVWGWYPGIYVKAQRLSAVPRACEGSMHTAAPGKLAQSVDDILAAFERHRPEVIIDTRKRHFPWNRPPLELWPRATEGYLSRRPETLAAFEANTEYWLGLGFGSDERERFRAVAPLRRYVISHYAIAAEFGDIVLFRRLNDSSGDRHARSGDSNSG